MMKVGELVDFFKGSPKYADRIRNKGMTLFGMSLNLQLIS